MVEAPFVHLIISFINPVGFILTETTHKRVMWNTWWWVWVAAVCSCILTGSLPLGLPPSTLERNFLCKHFCSVWKTPPEAYLKHAGCKPYPWSWYPSPSSPILKSWFLKWVFLSTVQWNLGYWWHSWVIFAKMAQNSKPALPCSPKGPQSSG